METKTDKPETTAADAAQECCSTQEKATCCAPAEKAACCGPAKAAKGGSCGCR